MFTEFLPPCKKENKLLTSAPGTPTGFVLNIIDMKCFYEFFLGKSWDFIVYIKTSLSVLRINFLHFDQNQLKMTNFYVWVSYNGGKQMNSNFFYEIQKF